jgi:GTPase SAR1 family protein
MGTLFDRIVTVVVGAFTGVGRVISDSVSGFEDFLYVKIRGLPFVVLGSRQTGKTTLIEWLRNNMETVDEFIPEPTAAGGEVVPEFDAKVDGDRHIKLKPTRDVGGEYAMWETDWVELFRQAKPRGIIFLVDHNDLFLHKDALNFVMQMIDDEREAASNLKAFFIFVNKSDLWKASNTLEDLRQNYKNELKRLNTQANRFGFKWAFFDGSLMTGEGVREALQKFFNTIRPKPRTAA